MNPIITNLDIDLKLIKSDVLEIPNTMKPRDNRYDVLFNCNTFDTILNSVIKIISDETNEIFDIYIKRLQGYIQTNDSNTPIIIERQLKNGILPIPKYSFIYMIDAFDTKLEINSNIVNPLNGDLIIFKTINFVKDECSNFNRIALIGSITNELNVTSRNNLL